MANIRKEIRDAFAGLSGDQILNELLEAGFNVKKGTGKITIKDDINDEELSFQLQTRYTLKAKIGSGKAVGYTPQKINIGSGQNRNETPQLPFAS